MLVNAGAPVSAIRRTEGSLARSTCGSREEALRDRRHWFGSLGRDTTKLTPNGVSEIGKLLASEVEFKVET